MVDFSSDIELYVQVDHASPKAFWLRKLISSFDSHLKMDKNTHRERALGDIRLAFLPSAGHPSKMSEPATLSPLDQLGSILLGRCPSAHIGGAFHNEVWLKEVGMQGY